MIRLNFYFTGPKLSRATITPIAEAPLVGDHVSIGVGFQGRVVKRTMYYDGNTGSLYEIDYDLE